MPDIAIHTVDVNPSGKITAAQIEESCPTELADWGKRIATHLDNADKCEERAEQHRVSAGLYIALAVKACDESGFDALREKFFPKVGRSRAFELKAVAAGKKSFNEIRALTRERVARYRARRQSVTSRVTDSTGPEPAGKVGNGDADDDPEKSAEERKLLYGAQEHAAGGPDQRDNADLKNDPADPLPAARAPDIGSTLNVLFDRLRQPPSGKSTSDTGPTKPEQKTATGKVEAENEGNEASEPTQRTPSLLDLWRKATPEQQRQFLEGVELQELIDVLPVHLRNGLEARLLRLKGLQRDTQLTKLLTTALGSRSPAEQITALGRMNEILTKEKLSNKDVHVRVPKSK